MSEYQNHHSATRACPRSSVYRLRNGYKVQFHIDGGAIQCQWSPSLPPAKLVEKLLPAYLKARDSWLRTLGLRIVVVDV